MRAIANQSATTTTGRPKSERTEKRVQATAFANLATLPGYVGGDYREPATQRIFGVDNYLGKEAIQNLFHFQFAKALPEPIRNRHYVVGVQIAMAERFDLGMPFDARWNSARSLRPPTNHAIAIRLVLSVTRQASLGTGSRRARLRCPANPLAQRLRHDGQPALRALRN